MQPFNLDSPIGPKGDEAVYRLEGGVGVKAAKCETKTEAPGPKQDQDG